MSLTDFTKSILGDIKHSTVSRNSRRSMQWLVNKLQSSIGGSVTQASRPIVGKMYLYAYDAKTKDTLPYWDVNPLIIAISPAPRGFFGLNFHYLPSRDRNYLLEQLVPFQKLVSSKDVSKIKISYAKLVGLTNSVWKHAFKRYLFSQMVTRMIEIPTEEWQHVIDLPLAHFKGATQTKVWADRKKYK